MKHSQVRRQKTGELSVPDWHRQAINPPAAGQPTDHSRHRPRILLLLSHCSQLALPTFQ